MDKEMEFSAHWLEELKIEVHYSILLAQKDVEIANLNSHLEATNRTVDSMRSSNHEIRDRLDTKVARHTDFITSLLSRIGKSDKVLITKSGDVRVISGKGKSRESFESGNLFSNVKEALPLKSRKPIPEAMKIGFVSFRESDNRTRKAPTTRKQRLDTKDEMLDVTAVLAVFPFLLGMEIVALNEVHPDLEITEEIVYSNPKEYFNAEVHFSVSYFVVEAGSGNKVYFQIENKNPKVCFISGPDGKMKSIK